MEQVISKHPIIGLERIIVIENINLSFKDEFIIIHLHTDYIKDDIVIDNLSLQDVEYIVISDDRTSVKIKHEGFKDINYLKEEDKLTFTELATGYTISDIFKVITTLDSYKAFD